ncbi:FAD:protein FMN transferase [Salegentibacter chungangensis]|uniref:FAD:protein FMN transferase n=1 Tax=Salegentibacter chungangensis TaxID=1335724 RepID=A0ABW3NRU7_9FLAO
MRKTIVLLCVFQLFMACKSSEEEVMVYRGEALGTTYQVKYFGEQIGMEKALDSIFEDINASMSTYREESDISRINAGDTLVTVNDHFREVFEASRRVYQESNGYFDPTVGILVNAYGFGPEKQLEEPEKATLDSLRAYVGFNRLQLSSDNKVKKDSAKVYLDFNAIAKGFTIDVIARYLDSKAIDNYLIELGGELVAKGRNLAKQDEWLVAIDDPRQEKGERKFQAILALKDQAMATSGNYRKFRVDSATGNRYVHTINPLTGLAEKSNLLSASVLAENCMLADAYATAFMALGLERSREMLEKLDGVEVYFIYAEDDKQKVSVFASEGFKKALRE